MNAARSAKIQMRVMYTDERRTSLHTKYISTTLLTFCKSRHATEARKKVSHFVK